VHYTDKIFVGIVDADLLDNGTRHPNLVLMKIAGFLKDHSIAYKLIINEKDDIECITHIYLSKVFTFTKEPLFISSAHCHSISKGGTGYYANETNDELFEQKREEDMHALEKDPFLVGFDLAKQMPDYNLYNEFIEKKISKENSNIKKYKDYQQFSIGFLTRGCIRQCPFCVNKNITTVTNYSALTDFVDMSRPKIYLWDDNFLASPNWKTLLLELQATNKPFQFRQGLDIRLMTEEKASLLAKSRYHGDFLFAFDRIQDMDIIRRKLTIWKSATKKTTKLYLFCGYQVTDNESLYYNVLDLFKRIKVLMEFGCLPYVMRHEDYKNAELRNIYVQIARWCNQPQFYKKLSFKEFVYRNQYYTKNGTCRTLITFLDFINTFKDREKEFLPYFDMKFESINKYLSPIKKQ